MRTSVNYVQETGQVFKKKSLTVPGMSIPIRDLLYKYTRVPELYRPGIYHNDDFDSALPVDLDISERAEIYKRANEVVREIKEKKANEESEEVKK